MFVWYLDSEVQAESYIDLKIFFSGLVYVTI